MKKFFKILGLLSLLAIIALGANGGCGCPGPGTGTPGLGKITGYVSSSVLETTRIPGATITVTGGGKTYTTTTDGMGSYTIYVPAGTYTVSASKETFNTKTQDNVTVTADGTTTLNFALTTGSGENIENPSLEGLFLYGLTHPSQIDVRSIVGRVTSKSDIKDLIKSLPFLRDTGGDYKTTLSLSARFTSTLPSGTQGVRLYIGTSSNGPFILVTGLGIIWGSTQLDTTICNLQPDTNYYLYLSLYGTWGETVSPELIEFGTPKELGLIQPGNNYIIPSNTTDPIHFEWDNLGQGWSYDFAIRDMEGNVVFSPWSTTSNSYDIDPSQIGQLAPGEYLWSVVGEYYTSSSRGEITIEKWYSSISYPRKIIVEQSNP